MNQIEISTPFFHFSQLKKIDLLLASKTNFNEYSIDSRQDSWKREIWLLSVFNNNTIYFNSIKIEFSSRLTLYLRWVSVYVWWVGSNKISFNAVRLGDYMVQSNSYLRVKWDVYIETVCSLDWRPIGDSGCSWHGFRSQHCLISGYVKQVILL